MDRKKSILQNQLDQQKFLHAVAYVYQSSGGIKKLTSSELSHLNQSLVGPVEEAWRLEPTEIEIPTGKKIQFNIVNNPINQARMIIGNAFQMAGNSQVFQAAAYLYSQLVLEHLFKDANRRTAVLATLWLLLEHEVDINAEDLHSIPIGDLREAKSISVLSERIKTIANSAAKNK